jgi:hypothetical protein
MDPILQATLTALVAAVTLVLGFIFVIPLADRIADHFERRGKRRSLPPAE